MAVALFQHSNPIRFAGEAVDVFADDFPLTPDHRRLLLHVRCSQLTVAQARSIYLKSGVPDAVIAARDAADAALATAIRTGGDVTAAKAAARAAALESDPATWPTRLRYIDLSGVPTAVRNRINAHWAARAGAHAAAKAAAHARFIAFLDRSPLGPLTAEEKLRPKREWEAMLHRRWKAAKDAGAPETLIGKLDALVDRIRAESRAGWRNVEDQAFAGLQIPNEVTVTAAQLQTVTRTRDVAAFHAAAIAARDGA